MEQVKIVSVLSRARLMSRDLEVLKYLATRRIAKALDLKERFWPKGKHKNHFARLTALARMNLIHRVTGDNGVRLGYRITPEGMRCLSEWNPKYSALSFPPAMRPSTYQHDLVLGRIQEIFESCSAVSSFMPEHEVRRALVRKHGIQEAREGGFKVPDALFWLKVNGGSLPVALELEIAQKAILRYRKIFRKLSSAEDFRFVFIVAKDEKLQKLIEKQLEFARQNDPWVSYASRRNGIYFTTLGDLLRDGKTTQWRGEKGSIRLSDYEDSPKQAHNPGHRLKDKNQEMNGITNA